MPVVSAPGMRPVRMGENSVEMTRGADGVFYVKSRFALGDYPRSMTDCLRRWAKETPDRVFLADRGPDGRRHGLAAFRIHHHIGDAAHQVFAEANLRVRCSG